MKIKRFATALASAALVTSTLFTPADAITPSPISETNNPGYSLQNALVSGKGWLPTAVYRARDNHLVYVNSMPSFPAGHQFAYIRNGYGSNRYMVFQHAGTRTLYATCVTPGHTRLIGSDVVSAWIGQGYLGYSCTPGHTMYSYL